MIPREFPCLPVDMRYILSYKAIIINAVSYWRNAKTQTCLHERLIFLSYSRDYESISLCAATLVQMKIRMNGKVSAISNESYYFGSIIFLLFRQNIRNVSNIKLFVAHSTGKERNLNHIADLASLIQIISKNYTILRRPWNFFSFEKNLRRLSYSSM